MRVVSTQCHQSMPHLHPSSSIVRHVIQENNLPFYSMLNKTLVCDACQQGKIHQLPYPSSNKSSSFPLEIMHSNVWGHAPVSTSGYKYYVSFVDDYSKFTWIYLMKNKSEVFSIFMHFQSHVERLLNRKIVYMQTDWGGQHRKLHPFFNRVGISHHISCPHAHQQNGTAERKHRHIVDVGLSLLAHVNMHIKFWDDAFQTACFLINRNPSKVINLDTPMHCLFGSKPDYSLLRTFGCACWPNLRPYNTHKHQFRSKRCVFLGYSPFHKGYKCLHVATRWAYISHDAIFDEMIFLFAQALLIPYDSPSTESPVILPSIVSLDALHSSSQQYEGMISWIMIILYCLIILLCSLIYLCRK